MNYQDILTEIGNGSALTAENAGRRIGRGKLSARGSGENEDHHLWNNRGTWWCHFTLHRPDYTSERIRVSLRTKAIEEARVRRDELFHALS
jgi:hypothetical protein